MIRRSQWCALALVGAIVCDAWVASGDGGLRGTLVAGDVGLLTLMEVGPAVPHVGIFGGVDDCDCKSITNTGPCTAETGQTCNYHSDVCESPTSLESCEAKLDANTIRECSGTGCASIEGQGGVYCHSVENCGGGT